MTDIIKLALIFAAAYCGGMWLYTAFVWRRAGNVLTTREARQDVERYTFHLGLCFIIAIGFLGVMQ